MTAGYIPKKMPTDAEKPRPMANDHQGSEMGKPESRWTPQPTLPPSSDAEHAAERSQQRGLHQELKENLRAPAPSAFADADLARPLGDRDRHDGHHADAAHHQRDRRDDDQREERRLADPIPELQHRVLRDEVEVVRFVEPEAVADPHHAFDVCNRVLLADAVSGSIGDLNRQDGTAGPPPRPTVMGPQAEPRT